MNVVFAHTAFMSLESWLRDRLGPQHTVRFVPPDDFDAPNAGDEAIHVLITARFAKEWTHRFPKLKMIHTAGAGLDRIELSAVPSGVRVCRTFGHGPSMAEYIFMAMMALQRDIFAADRELRGGRWRSVQFNPELPLPETLGGKSVVVLGTGEIGTATANLCRAFGVRAIGFNTSGHDVPGAGFERILPVVALSDELPGADFLVVVLPLSDRTRGLVGAAELGRLKAGAFVVNVARGPVVDEAALFDVLRRRAIAGAAIDVWYAYPPPGSDCAEPSRFPFRELDNVLMTPHLSGATGATFRHRAEDIASNIIALAGDRPLRNEVPRTIESNRP